MYCDQQTPVLLIYALPEEPGQSPRLSLPVGYYSHL